MGDGDHDRHAILCGLPEHVLIKPQPLLVGRLLLPCGENAGPVDGGSKNIEPRLPEQRQILGVTMVKINGLVGWIVVRVPAQAPEKASGLDVGRGRQFP